MFELVIVVCLATRPDDCHTHVVVAETPSTQTCWKSLQPEAAKWINENPEYEVKSLTCLPGRGA